MNFDDVKYFVKSVSMTLYDHRADIAFYGGIGLSVGGTALAIKATNDIQPKFANHKARMNAIDENENMTPEEKKKARREICRETLVEIFKVYSLPVAMEIAGIICEIYSHTELKTDLSSTNAALSAMMVSYEGLKSRIIATEGEDKWRELAYGQNTGTNTIVDMQTGEVKEEFAGEIGKDNFGVYSVLFYEPNPKWNPGKGMNKRFITMIEGIFQRKLRSEGVVFLKDVLVALGFDIFQDCPESTAKAGWVYRNPDGSTNTLSFGLDSKDEMTLRFMNDLEESVRLEFNCVPNVYTAMKLMPHND